MPGDTERVFELLQDGQEEISRRLPGVLERFKDFAGFVTGKGLLAPKLKELMAVAVAVGIRCQPCIVTHVKRALEEGATAEEILEACGVAIMMGGGPSIAYTSYVVEALRDFGTLDRDEEGGGSGDAL